MRIDYHVDYVPVDDIVVDEGREPLQEDAVVALMESLAHGALLHPIALRWVGGIPHLVAGRHRLEVYRRLRYLGDIPAIEVEGDDLEAELMMLDENVRKRIDPLAESFATKRRAELLRLIDAPVQREEVDERAAHRAFLHSEATRLGVVLRTVQKRLRRAEALTPAALDAIRAHPEVLNADRPLDMMSQFETETEQLAEAQRWLEASAKKEARKRSPAHRFVKRFEAMSPEVQREALARIMGTEAGRAWMRDAAPHILAAVRDAA